MGSSCSNTATNTTRPNAKPGVVDLFVFPRTKDHLHVSVPCRKVENFLRIARIDYVLHCTMDFDVSPSGRLPCAIINNRVIAESEFIIDELIKAYPERVAAANAANHLVCPLPPAQERFGRVLRVSWEYSRLHILRFQLVDNIDWTVDSSRDYAPSVPRWVLSVALSRQFRKPAIEGLNWIGEGDLSDAQYQDELLKDVKILEELIQENNSKNKKDTNSASAAAAAVEVQDNNNNDSVAAVEGDDGFLLSTGKPSRYDCSLVGNLLLINMTASYLGEAKCPAFASYVLKSPTLQSYCKRMNAAVWGADGKLEERLKNEAEAKKGTTWSETYLFE